MVTNNPTPSMKSWAPLAVVIACSFVLSVSLPIVGSTSAQQPPEVAAQPGNATTLPVKVAAAKTVEAVKAVAPAVVADQGTELAFQQSVTLVDSAAVAGDSTAGLQVDAPGTIHLAIGRSKIIKAPWAVKRVSVAEPKTADIQVASLNHVVVMGKAVGATDVMLFNEDGDVARTRVSVDVDINSLKADLKKLFPTATLDAIQTTDVLIITGTLRHADQAKQVRDFLDSTGIKYLNMTKVAGVHQVMLKVRVAEASRTAIRQLGVNAVSTGSDAFGASTIGGNANNIDIGVPAGSLATKSLPFTFNSPTSVSSAVTLFGGFPDMDLQFFLSALEDNQYMRVLAEPTLIAMSGEEASFLAGGEFPIPIVQGGGSSGGTSISVEFKEFGVRLRFRPTVMGDGAIRLVVAPEVSDLSDVGAVVIDNFRIPAVVTRKAQTTLQMKSGQTFAMAGLIDRNTTARVQQVPALGDVPVLGSLFRSVRYEEGETELVVLVSVELVEPLSTTDRRPLPGMLHRRPDDWSLYLNGQIEGRARAVSAPNAKWMKEKGLANLKGPGAWASHDQPRVPLMEVKAIEEKSQPEPRKKK